MDFEDRLVELSRRLDDRLAAIQTEEATKNALVMPFINALGYNVFDPTEVVPEFTADVGTKKGEKVDYAIFQDGRMVILVECKARGVALDINHGSQLYRYFSVTDARFAILTNGVEYQFYSDLEAPNRMDSKPFLEVDLRRLNDGTIEELRKFSKSSFDLDSILETASDLKYTKAIKRLIGEELSQPSEDLVRLVASRVYSGRLTSAVKEQFAGLTRRAFNQFVSERISGRLKTALAEEEYEVAEVVAAAAQPEEVAPVIETTDDELQAYYVVKAILSEMVLPSRVAIRDRKSYCGILLDDNNRKPICRLHFNTSQHYLGLLDGQKQETRHPIEGPDDLYRFAAELRSAAERYDQQQSG